MAASLRSPSYDVGQYVECPGPTVDGIHTGMCKAIIPRAIFCTGANSGKRCQRCDQCKYFVWLPFENSGYPSPSPSRATFPSRTFSPHLNRSNHSSGGLDNINRLPALMLDPALRESGPPLSQVPSTSRAGAPKEKIRCANSPCTRQGTVTCTKAMCKTCCINNVSKGACFNKGHNGGVRPVTSSQDPFHLPRPVPSIPLRLPATELALDFPAADSSQAASRSSQAVNQPADTTEPHPFHFGKPVPAALAADWTLRRQQRELKQQSEASRVENERRIKHTVLLIAYLGKGEDPIPLPLQDIKTWPTLNLAHLPHLLTQLCLQKGDVLELYVRTSHGSFWIPTVDHSMTVKTDEKIFIRKKGVHTSLHPSTFANPMADFSTSSPSFQTPTRKRGRRESESISPMLMRPSKIAFLDLTGDDDELISPQAGVSPSFPLKSRAVQTTSFGLSVSPSPLPTGHIPSTDSLDDACVDSLDRVWLSGSVITPEALGVVWPNQIYVRDMAQAFAFLANSTNQGDLPSRFSCVFNGMTFKQSTYHSNRKFWSQLPHSVQESARNLPRTPAGLWTTWRKDQPGWK